MKNNMTAVEWLQSGLDLIMSHEQQMQAIGLFEQAKEMEKEQIIDAREKGIKDGYKDYIDIECGRDSKIMTSEQYYNETFNK